jgi:hypothetical protein
MPNDNSLENLGLLGSTPDKAAPMGPAIQMFPADHVLTSSHPWASTTSADYRQAIQDMISNGDWSKAMATEMNDVRAVAREVGQPGKYNQAMLEAIKYFKCLRDNGLLK